MAGYDRFVHKPFVWFAVLAGVGLALPAGCGVPRSPVAQSPGPASTPGLYDLAFVELSERIHVAYRPDVTRTPVHGNVTLLFNEYDVVVVDAGNSPVSALDYRFETWFIEPAVARAHRALSDAETP